MEAYREGEDVWQLAEAVQYKCNDSECNVCAQDTKGSNADKIPEELLLLDGKASIEDDWW